MPELPEVEAVRAGVAPLIAGHTIESTTVWGTRVARHHAVPADALSQLVGRRIEAVARRGKFMWLVLDQGPFLIIHLGMSGQLRVGPVEDERHLRARLQLSDGVGLSFVDQRTFGYLRLAPAVPTPDGGPGGTGSPVAALPAPVAHIARDVLDPALDHQVLSSRVRASGSGIKRLLLDQELASGIGNIYADEALWAARLHPATAGRALSHRQISELYGAAAQVMRRSLAQGGTSFDRLYVDVTGRSGYFAIHLEAYGRTGEDCRRCGTAIERITYAGRSSHLCPHCQPLPSLGDLAR